MCEFIVKGDDIESSEPEESLGKLMLDSLKSKNLKDVALIDGLTKTTLTYGDILNATVKCALALKKKGIRRNDVVAIISENNLNYCIPIIACWYIGAQINVLSPMYSPKEMEHILQITRPKLIFYSEVMVTLVQEMQFKLSFIENTIVLNTDEFNTFLESSSSGNCIESFKPETDFDIKEQVSTILCSSGTSGFPKAVMLTHDNIRYCFMYLKDKKFGDLQAGDVTTCPIPYFHIFGMFLLIFSIKNQLKIVNMSRFKPDVYLGNIEEFKVNKLFIVPSLGVFLAKSPLVQKYDLSSVKDVYCGAAPVSKEIEALLRNVLKINSVRQVYGLTENAGGVSMIPKENAGDKIGSAGKVIPFITVKITDIETGKILNKMEPGEICVKGPTIMKGYVRNEEATKDMFDEDGWMKTGDVGYFDEDGYLFIVDRIKELIKYKGFQVAPAELESILLSHPGVKEAAVVGKQDERAGELPTAFVVPNPLCPPKEQDLLDLVASQLNLQKHLHGGVIFIDELPKNPTGKILRRNLRELLNKQE